jgi:hypothetical protein
LSPAGRRAVADSQSALGRASLAGQAEACPTTIARRGLFGCRRCFVWRSWPGRGWD